MKPDYRSFLAVIVMAVLPVTGFAATLNCDGKLIKPGDTVKHLYAACGYPETGEGAELLYEGRGPQPVVVTVKDGVVTTISDMGKSKAFGRREAGNRP